MPKPRRCWKDEGLNDIWKTYHNICETYKKKKKINYLNILKTPIKL